MLEFMQPILSMLIGVAMSIFGLIHTWYRFPAPVVWAQFLASVPQLGAVLLFAACLAVSILGVAMLLVGAGGVRRRLQQIRSVRWQPNNDHEGARHEWT